MEEIREADGEYRQMTNWDFSLPGPGYLPLLQPARCCPLPFTCLWVLKIFYQVEFFGHTHLGVLNKFYGLNLH